MATERPPPVGSEHYVEESHIQWMMEACFEYIVKSLDWTDLLAYPYFKTEDIRKFKDTNKKGGSTDATREMLLRIMELEQPDRFSRLVAEVEDSDNSKVLKILKAEKFPITLESSSKAALKKNIQYIGDNMQVIEILPDLIASKLISERQAKDIRETCNSTGSFNTALDLMFLVTNKEEYWLPKFLLCLIECSGNYSFIAKEIDPHLTEELERDRILPGFSIEKFITQYRGDFSSLLTINSFHPTSSGKANTDTDGNTSPNCPALKLSDSDSGPEPRMQELYDFNDDKAQWSTDVDNGQPMMHHLSFDSGETSVNNLSPNKPDENVEISLADRESVKKSLTDDMSFSSLLLNVDNTEQPGYAVETNDVQEDDTCSFDNLLHDSSLFPLSAPSTTSSQLSEVNNLKLERKMPSSTSSPLSKENNTSSEGERTEKTSPVSASSKPETDLSKFQLLTKALKPNDTEFKQMDDCGQLTNLRSSSSSSAMKEAYEKTKDVMIYNRESPDGLNITDTGKNDCAVSNKVDDENSEGEEIQLRKYQQELAAPAIEGKNVVIVAPTGSGKTRVAFKIIQEHIQRLQGHGIPKVVFLVNQVALANQQGTECKKLLPMYKCHTITGESQRNKSEYLKDFMDKRDILVVTAQVLLDALVRKEIESISRFSLIIFDECHHTQANHPFNQIMGLYLELKFSKKHVDLPQIVGLTASVGVGKARDVGKAVDHIKRLMANLDAHLISTVMSNIGELREYVSMPDEETKIVARRSNDVFGNNMVKLMTTLEKRMAISSVVKEMEGGDKFEKELKAPAEKGNAAYTQWVSKLWKEIAKLRDEKARKFLQPCRTHLEYYNNALIIYNDARVQDSMRYLEQEMARWKDQALHMDQNEKIIYEAYKKLKKAPMDATSENPKLEMLREMIMSSYSRCDIENSRGIVFVKTRELARAIVSWMKDTPGLRELNPIQFVGNQCADKGGMTKVEQDDALKFFREGKHKLIVATSVAEEGLDITKCNLVIRYDHVTNEISKVQSRGRGRAADSKYVVIAEENTGMAEKEELNMIREVMMRKAIIELQTYIATNADKFDEELSKFQEEANLEQQLRLLGKKRLTMRPGRFELKCLRCGAFVCMSDNVKKIEDAHHVVVDESLKERVIYSEKDARGGKEDDGQLCGKISCTKCGGNLGVISIHKSLPFPVLKIENFLVVDGNGRQTTCKQWKKVPFAVEALGTEDYKEILNNRGENGQL